MGDKIRRYEVTWRIILIGVVLYTMLSWIPLIGWIAKFLIVLTALDAMVAITLKILKEWR